MDLEDRVRTLEKEYLSTSNKLWELIGRVARLEKLVSENPISVQAKPSVSTHVEDDTPSINGEETFQKLSSLCFQFNHLLPHLGELLTGQKTGTNGPSETRINCNNLKQQLGTFKSDAFEELLSRAAKAEERKIKNITGVPPFPVSQNDAAKVSLEQPDMALKTKLESVSSTKAINQGVKTRSKKAKNHGSSFETDSESQSAGENAPKSKVCRKLCQQSKGHPCNAVHDSAVPCPPCQTLTDLKLKCGHRVNVLCHRQNKINDVCSECETKRLMEEAPVYSSLQSPPFAFDPLQSPAEIDFKKVRDILKKISSSNFDKLAEELMSVVNNQSKYLPEFANLFIEKAIMDAPNQSLTIIYAKLISSVVNPPSGRLKMLAIEVAHTLFTVVALLFKLPCRDTPSIFVANLMRKREVIDMDPKPRNLGILRFVGELYNYDVLELDALKDQLIEPLLEKATEETLDYLCKILTLVGSRINGEVSRNGKASDMIWFDGLFAKLELLSSNPARSNASKFALLNLIELKKAGWDRFKRRDNVIERPTASRDGVAQDTEPEIIQKSEVVTPAVVKKKLSEPSALPALSAFPSPDAGSENFWECAPWGEHTDPLATFPSLCHSNSSPDLLLPPFMTYGAVVKSTASSFTMSPATSVTSLPVKNKLPAEINVQNLFAKYEQMDGKPRPVLIQWLRQKLKQYDEKQLRDFVRRLTRHTKDLTKRKELAAMGHLLDVLIRAEIVTEDTVVKAFLSGIVSDLPIHYRSNQEIFSDIVEKVSTVLVTCWEHRMQDLSWLAGLGKNQSINYPDVWSIFSFEVLNEVLNRKKIKSTQEVFRRTNPAGQEILKRAAKRLKLTSGK